GVFPMFQKIAASRLFLGCACSARPDLHTVCRSFPKISSALSAKVCGGSKLAKILIRDRDRTSPPLRRGRIDEGRCVLRFKYPPLFQDVSKAHPFGNRIVGAVVAHPKRTLVG